MADGIHKNGAGPDRPSPVRRRATPPAVRSVGGSWDGKRLAVASFERETIVERIKAGMEAAKVNGRHVGRPRNKKRLARIRKLRDEGRTVIQIPDLLGIARQAVYSALAKTT